MKKKDSGIIHITFCIMLIFICVLVLIFTMKMKMFYHTKTYVDDGLTGANLAAATIDIEGIYGEDHNLNNFDYEGMYKTYLRCLGYNLDSTALNPENGLILQPNTNKHFVSNIKVLKFYVYNKRNDGTITLAKVVDSENSNEGTSGIYYGSGNISHISEAEAIAPDGTQISNQNTSMMVYSQISFHLNSLYGTSFLGTRTEPIYVTKHHTVDVVDLHNYQLTDNLDPTCLTEGYKKYECTDCHDTYTSNVAALGHDLTDWNTETEATCTTNGLEKRNCRRCSYEEEREIPAYGHNLGEWEVTLEATCTEKGEEKKKCSRCTYEETRETNALGHELDDGQTIKEATCTEKGLIRKECKRCEYSEEEVTNAKGHNWDEWIIDKNETCTENGSQSRVCSVCQESETMIRTMLGHNFSDWETVTYVTCETDGLEKRVCERCNYEETNVIKATGHEMGEWTVSIPLTCVEDGLNRRECNKCDYYEEQSVAAKGHTWLGWVLEDEATCQYEGTEINTCSVCNTKEIRRINKTNHNYISTVIPATCTTEGKTVYECDICGNEYEEDIVPALGHDWEEWIETKTPTCAENGEGERTRNCKRGDITETEIIPRLDHTDENDDKICDICGEHIHTFEDKTATWTHTENGIVRNGEHYETNQTNATAEFDISLTEDVDYTIPCGRFGNEPVSMTILVNDAEVLNKEIEKSGTITLPLKAGNNHVEIQITTIENTTHNEKTYNSTILGEYSKNIKDQLIEEWESLYETETGCGNYNYTLTYGNQIKDIVDDQGNSTAATFTEYTAIFTCNTDNNGAYFNIEDISYHRCTECSYTEKHTMESVSKTEATCTVMGEERTKCKYCSHTEDVITPALGHKWISQGDNVEKHICTRCGETEDHTLTLIEQQSPTCTTDGTKTEECTICGSKITTVLPATGHTWESTGASLHKCSVCQITESHNFTSKNDDVHYCADCNAEFNHDYQEINRIDATYESEGEVTYKCNNCSNEKTDILEKIPIPAFAIYSADDNSLNFYSRKVLPSEGDIFEGLTVTNIYTGFDNTEYTIETDVPWNLIREQIKKVNTIDEIVPISTAYWFYDFTNCEKINLEKLNTKNITNMRFMFTKAGYNVTTFDIGDLSKWNITKVTNTSYMFYNTGYNAKTFTLDVSDWNTSNVTDMKYMFGQAGYNANTWSIGDLSKWDVSNVTDMKYMFFYNGYNASKFDIGNLDNWKTSKVIDMRNMFYYTGYGANDWNIGDLSKWDVSNVTDMKYMFFYAGYNVSNFDIGNLDNWKTSKVIDMSYMFYNSGYNSTSWNIGDISDWVVSNVENMDSMFFFAGYNATYQIDLSNWNTNKVTIYDNFNYGVESKITAPVWAN